jgi:hypothetical protein
MKIEPKTEFYNVGLIGRAKDKIIVHILRKEKNINLRREVILIRTEYNGFFKHISELSVSGSC